MLEFNLSEAVYLSMTRDTLVAPTLVVLQASNAVVQVPTWPAKMSANRDLDEANQWAEKLFAAAKPASNDAARFAANLLADFA